VRRRPGLHSAGAGERRGGAEDVPARGAGVFLTPDVALETGRKHFNAGRFFEAHDAWEAEWLRATGPRRLLLQGLIQVAAALFKASRRVRPSGCVQLLAKGLAKLERFPDGEGGLALEDLRRDLDRFLVQAVAWKAGGPPPDPALFPRLRLV
jgi:predicted metal-dependent hydrolase